MKTSIKQFTVYGDTALVQISLEPETLFPFKPGGPEMKRDGQLNISEVIESGVVGQLNAVNLGKTALLLTDADVLIGAKQNRILNRSVLLAPGEKTVLDVSCIERLRWHYVDRYFTNPQSTADPSLRFAKASSISNKRRQGEYAGNTQFSVWNHIRFAMAEENISNKTESYYEMEQSRLEEKAQEFPACEAEKGCHGVGVVTEGKVQCIDLFGTEEIFRYYFPLLRDSAFRRAQTGKMATVPEIHESTFKVLDALDRTESLKKVPVSDYIGLGDMNISEDETLLSFDLSYKNEIIHKVIFGK